MGPTEEPYEAAERKPIPSIIFGILSIYALYKTTRLLFGKKEALFAASYLAILPYHIYFSQMARGYATCLFFCILSLYYFIKSIKENRIKFWIGYIVFSVLSIYSHLTSLSCIPVHISFFGILSVENFLSKKKRFWTIDKRRLLRFSASVILIAVIVFLLYLPFPKQTQGPITQVRKFSRPIGEFAKIFLNLIRQTFIWETQSWNQNSFFSILLFVFAVIESSPH